MDKPKNLYFRVKDNGAAVFRVDIENRQRRLDFDQIAVVNLNRGEIKPQGDAPPNSTEIAQINDWIDARKTVVSNRQIDDIKRAIDHLNTTTQWVQSKATDDQINEFADELLMAMHDLRMVLVRKKSDQIKKG